MQEESKTLIRATLQKPEISAGSMGHLARKGYHGNPHQISLVFRAPAYRVGGSVWFPAGPTLAVLKTFREKVRALL